MPHGREPLDYEDEYPIVVPGNKTKKEKKSIEEKINKLERELSDLDNQVNYKNDNQVNSKKVKTTEGTILGEPLSDHQHTFTLDSDRPTVTLPQGATIIEAGRIATQDLINMYRRQLPDNEIWSVTPRSGTVPVRLIDARARAIITSDEYHHAIKNHNLQPDDSIWVRKDLLADEKDHNCKKIINIGKGEIVININEKDEYTQGQKKLPPGQLGAAVTLTYDER